MSSGQTFKRPSFLDLPGEIRELIYTNVFRSINNKHDHGGGHNHYKYDLSLMRVNQQLYYETRKIFRQNNIFVSIETPWNEAQEHVRNDGYVPILITAEQASRFNNQHLAITIDVPRHPNMQTLRKFIILLDDLPKFTTMWFYSDLSHPGLNSNLRLTLNLQDPYASDLESRPVPKALQQQLLEPFGMIKELYELELHGVIYESAKQAMKDAMAIPYKSPAQCLEEATQLKEDGNKALGQKAYRAAISLYEQSFLALHIVCDGRRRSVWGDAFFDREIHTGPFKDQHAQQVRFVLRIRLVANIVHAYLQLEEYDEARFWGRRTIDLMPRVLEGALEDETGGPGSVPLQGFVAAPEVGKIYFRTGMACKALGDKCDAMRWLKVAVKLLPNDLKVKAEYNLLGPRLG